MVKRMVVLGNEGVAIQELAQRGVPPTRDLSHGLNLDSLGAQLASGNEFDLKAISKRAAQIAEKRVIEKVLQQTRWNRKAAAERLQISYKALLYKMKDAGLGERD
jgi:two-component system response regulator AtoC